MALTLRLTTLKRWTRSPETSNPSLSLEGASWAASWPVPLAGDVRPLHNKWKYQNELQYWCLTGSVFSSFIRFSCNLMFLCLCSSWLWPGGDTDVPWEGQHGKSAARVSEQLDNRKSQERLISILHCSLYEAHLMALIEALFICIRFLLCPSSLVFQRV